MLDSENPGENPSDTGTTAPDTSTDLSAPSTEPAPTAKKAAKKTTKKAPAKRAARKTSTTQAGAAPQAEQDGPGADATAGQDEATPAKKTSAKKAATKKPAAKRTTKKSAADTSAGEGTEPAQSDPVAGSEPSVTSVLFKAPEPVAAPAKKKAKKSPEKSPEKSAGKSPEKTAAKKTAKSADAPKAADKPDSTAKGGSETGEDRSGGQGGDRAAAEDRDGEGGARRRRRRGGRRRRKSNGEGGDEQESNDNQDESGSSADESSDDDDTESGDGTPGSRRRRRRRRTGEDGDSTGADDPQKTVTRVRPPRNAEDEITSVAGSTRLEAKKQRRREGREAGRRRAPIVSEAEFLARRESVDRKMVIRQRADLTQIAVLEDKVLVEHYVARESQTSLIGNVYLGRVQNVLPSMEAAFIDIGKGRNAVLYAGEVNWDALGGGNGGSQRKIEQVLKSGQSVLVQVTKDPVGHKGARLTSQISLPGRFLVYVPDGNTSGISRKLPDTERTRLKNLLKEIVPDSAGVIVRTAAEGASEAELTRDVERLTARWEDISSKVKGGNAPELLYGEPDLTLKVVRDLFTEDFAKLVVSGDDAWDLVENYVKHVAPDLSERLERYDGDQDAFAAYRIDEQIAKGLDRKVWLPSGGSLVIDRTEAMTVVDVNTGKFTGSGGNLEETVTKNNLEAAEEIVRQLRLRDIGGIIVIDFIDMVLENNRDLVLRRLIECLGRDRTRHQVAEVTSLGLVQMTRKRIGTGLLEAFSETCAHCEGRGVIIHHEPVDPSKKQDDEPRRGRRGRGRGRSDDSDASDHGDERGGQSASRAPSPKDVAAIAKPDSKPVVEPEPDESATDTAEDRGGHTEADEPTAPQGAPETAEVVDEGTVPEEPVATEESASEESAPEESAPEESSPEDRAESSASPEPTEPTEPVAPRIVTRVRRGAARRPAGPPASASTESVELGEAAFTADGVGSSPNSHPAADSETGQTLDGVETSSVQTAVHVPIKRKGSRKR